MVNKSRPSDDEQGSTISYFDRLSDEYQRTSYPGAVTPSSYFFLSRKKIVEGALERSDDGRLIDIGCADGPYAELVRKSGYHYYGVDLSQHMVRRGRERLRGTEGAELLACDSKALPFPGESMDKLLCLGMLEYVPHPERKVYLREMTRVVKPGGF